MPIRGHMLKVGPFVFSMSTAAYDTLTRKDTWRWQPVETIGSEVQYQYMGPGERSITLKGVVFTHFDIGSAPGQTARAVGTGQMDALRGAGDMATPLQLTDGRGRSYGRWVITEMSNANSVFFDNGAEKKQEFDITLKYYGRSGFSLSFGLSLGLGIAFGGIIGGGSVSQVFASSNSLGSVAIGATVNPGAGVLAGIAGAGITDPANAGVSAGFEFNATIGG